MSGEEQGKWRRMESSLKAPEPVCWVVKEGMAPWSVNAQKGEAEGLADYLNALEQERDNLRAKAELADWLRQALRLDSRRTFAIASAVGTFIADYDALQKERQG